MLQWLVILVLGYDAVRLSRFIVEVGIGTRTYRATVDGKDITAENLTKRAVYAALHVAAFLAAIKLLG